MERLVQHAAGHGVCGNATPAHVGGRRGGQALRSHPQLSFSIMDNVFLG